MMAYATARRISGRSAAHLGAAVLAACRLVILVAGVVAMAVVPAVAQDVDVVSQNIADEICGDGIDNSASGHTEGSCPAGWMNAVYSDGCDFKCDGNDADNDGFPLSGSGPLTTGTAVVNGAQTGVNVITVDSGHNLYHPKWVRISDGGSPTDRQVIFHTATTIAVSGAAVSVIDNLVISATSNPAIDCDDADKTVFPGVHVQVSGDDYKTCLPSGSYTSTITGPLDESGSDDAYYIDCDAGVNGTGSFASPFNAIGMICGGASGTEPAGAVTLTPGDRAYVMDGTCSDTFNTTALGGSSIAVNCEFSQAGTAAKPIVIEGMPGRRPTISNSAGMAFGFADPSEYYHLRNLKITTPSGSNERGGAVMAFGANDIVMSRLYVHDVNGDGDNNDSGIRGSTVVGLRVSHSLIWNTERSFSGGGDNNVQNVSAQQWLADDGDTACRGNYSGFNTMGADTIDSAMDGQCWRFKHGLNETDCDTDGIIIEYNSCVNPSSFAAVMWDGSCLNFRRNVVYGGGSGRILYVVDPSDSGLNDQANNFVTDNTFIKLSMMNWNFVNTSAVNEYTIERNIFIDADASYSTGDKEGIISIHGNGSNADKATVEALNFLTVDENCYYNGSTTLNWCYYCYNDIPGTNDVGGNYNFSQWTSILDPDGAGPISGRYDQNSFVENQALDSSQRATSTNCQNFGARRLSESGTTTTTTTSTSTTTTTTSTTTTTTSAANNIGALVIRY